MGHVEKQSIRLGIDQKGFAKLRLTKKKGRRRQRQITPEDSAEREMSHPEAEKISAEMKARRALSFALGQHRIDPAPGRLRAIDSPNMHFPPSHCRRHRGGEPIYGRGRRVTI